MTKSRPKPRPKTGEKREVRQPLKIDLLPQSAKDAIKLLRDRGEPWPQIEAQSAKEYSANWEKDGGGFVDWHSLDLRVLEEFRDLRLPKSSLHRWFDIRMDQVRKQVLVESEQARAWASQFASKNLAEGNAAVVNAMRDQVFSLMRSVGPGDQAKFLDGLNLLGLTMSRLQRVELQAKRVSVDERKITVLEERERLARERVDQATQHAARKGTGQFSLEDINLLRERTFGLPPLTLAEEAAHG